VYAAVRQGARSAAGLPIDPVCRMAVDPWHSAGRLTHEGIEYCFCSRSIVEVDGGSGSQAVATHNRQCGRHSTVVDPPRYT
jgi:hypothetical protein